MENRVNAAVDAALDAAAVGILVVWVLLFLKVIDSEMVPLAPPWKCIRCGAAVLHPRWERYLCPRCEEILPEPPAAESKTLSAWLSDPKVEAQADASTTNEGLACQLCFAHIVAVRLSCGHLLCVSCARTHLAQKPSCPFCRAHVRSAPDPIFI
jgi:ribosomal protein S27AE